MNRLLQTIGLALIGLLLLLGVPSAVSWQSLGEISANSKRASVAHEVLDAHLMLGSEGERLALHLEKGGKPDDPVGRKTQATIDQQLTLIRGRIGEEIEIIGKGGASEEGEEFERLDRIARSISVPGQDGVAPKWREEIDTAIAHERAELEELKDRNARAVTRIQALTILALVGSLLMLVLGLIWLRRTIAAPAIVLFQGMQRLMVGDRDFRIEPSGQAAMRELHRAFNSMAEQIGAAAQVEAQNRRELESAVGSRSAELKQANAQLLEISERRKQFLADVSHELRTPLAIIGGEADVALRNSDATIAEHRESLVRVQDQARSMSRLVDDLLFMARNEAGPAAARLAPLNLTKLVEAVAASLRPLLIADGGTLDVHSSVPAARILGDEGRLRQLLNILLDNSIHYSEQAPEIEVSLDQTRDGFLVAVRDKGVGIDPAELPLLFERYRRGSQSAAKHDAGTGLGLPLAKAIAESHGGSITIESTPGAGTTVVVLLPEAAAGRSS